MNFCSNHHRVAAFSPPLIVEAKYVATVPGEAARAMSFDHLARALWGRSGACSEIEETVTGDLRTESVIEPSKGSLILERCERIRRNQLRRSS